MTKEIEKKSKDKSYFFLTDTVAYEAVETKSGKKYYVTGYISTTDMDLYNDIITEKCLKGMLDQINERTIMLDYEHEVFTENETLIPVGKINEAKIDKRGLWVKCELNNSSPKFKDMWGSIKGGFITAFSIAFKPLKSIIKQMGDVEVRILDELELLNVALTGNPVNRAAVVTDFGMKAIMLKAITELKDKEADNMSDENQDKPVEEPAPEAVPAEESKEEKTETVEEGAEAPAEEKPAEEAAPAENAEVEQKSNPQVEKLAGELKALKEQNENMAKELKSLKEAPIFKSQVQEKPEIKSKDERSILSML